MRQVITHKTSKSDSMDVDGLENCYNPDGTIDLNAVVNVLKGKGKGKGDGNSKGDWKGKGKGDWNSK